MDDRRILYATAFLRALSIGMAGVLISLFLAARGFEPRWIFFVVSAGLGGAALASLGVTLAGGQLERRRALVALSTVSVLGGVAFVFVRGPWAIALAAFVGMLNGMGRDRGAAAVMEQAILPATASDAERTRVFAWYNVLQDAGHACGALLAGLPSLLQHATAIGTLPAFQVAMLLPAILLLATVPLYRRLSPRIEPSGPSHAARLSPASRGVLWRISALFALDSIGGGFLTTALIVYFFAERFGVGSATISVLVFTARIANAGSHLAAAWLARRIGLLNTIVCTHMPSSLLLLTLPWAPSFPVAAALFLLREGLVEMDVPTRQSYVMAVVQPAERLTAAGVTSLVRLGGWAVAPMIAGGLIQSTTLGMPLVVGAATKVVYDFLLYVSFRAHRPPEER
jgi:predicted MFS family arabinose efflux permease